MPMMIAIHAGAGPLTPHLEADEPGARAALLRSLASARALLEDGAGALAVVRAAVEILEDYEGFNAGRGAALCSDGTALLSASIMRGSDRAAGAVAGLRTTKNPVIAAQAVLESDQVLLIGEPADALARDYGASQCENEYFITEHARERLREKAAAESRGTVGAVCIDGAGVCAAATSTGGISGQPPGRIGDSPLIGAGTWADERVAVSCTGDGEAFIRAGVARYIAALIEGGAELADACSRAIESVSDLGGTGGLIACQPNGALSMPFSTEAMPRGVWRAGAEAQVSVTPRSSDGSPSGAS
jgi:beta-aspartyl-peptidase (threonine type)